ncbi:MAG: YlxM family DNA-binding protein [Oscillospiraceae bacterium]|jgi:predicted DNA-binding protein YlxM (UPF0122 family)|nr:YlxM family DNA-binding protein [Oscillospiraceae bacterium]
MEKNLRISMLLDYYAPALTEKQRELVALYYNEDFSLSEISDNMGITRQAVRDGIKNGENRLLNLEEKLGFAGRFQNINNTLDKIIELSAKIGEYDPAKQPLKTLSDHAESIKKLAYSAMENA